MGNRIPYLIAQPQHQRGNRYAFQFQGSGSFDLKHFVNVSSTMAAAASLMS